MLIFSKYVLWLVFYSVAGWVYETIFCSIHEKKLVKRGFLAGPYCPIYGCGAVLVLLCLGRIENIVVLFFTSILLTGVLEYFTAWLLETLFHAKWWDYTQMRFNIKGRVCLAGALAFGTFSVVLIKFVHPYVAQFTDKISTNAIYISAAVASVVFVADIVWTVVNLTAFNKKLAQMQTYIKEALGQIETLINDTTQGEKGGLEKAADRLVARLERANSLLNEKIKAKLEENATFMELKNAIKAQLEKRSLFEKRTMYSFPSFKSTRYEAAVLKIKDYIETTKKNKKQ